MLQIIQEENKCRIKAPLCPKCKAPMIEFHMRVPQYTSDTEFADQAPEHFSQIQEYYFSCRLHRNQRYYLNPDELKILNQYGDYRKIIPER